MAHGIDSETSPGPGAAGEGRSMNNITNTVFTGDSSVVRLCVQGAMEPGS